LLEWYSFSVGCLSGYCLMQIANKYIGSRLPSSLAGRKIQYIEFLFEIAN
jgi:hypothetical protein